MWLDRLGARYGRLFVNTKVDLRSSLGTNFGNDLNGMPVTGQEAWQGAVELLRSTPGEGEGEGEGARWRLAPDPGAPGARKQLLGSGFASRADGLGT